MLAILQRLWAARRPERRAPDPGGGDAGVSHLERQLALRTLEARLLDELVAPDDGEEATLQRCLDRVCELAGWPVGRVFAPEAGGRWLAPCPVWPRRAPPAFARLRRATAETRLAPGEGLAGRVWVSGEPLAVRDLAAERERADLGVRGAFGFPVRVDGETLAVFEFFSDRAVEPDEELLSLVGHLGERMGRALRRQRGLRALRVNERRFATIFDRATVGLALLDLDRGGHYVVVNERYCALTGRRREELLERSFGDLIAPEERARDAERIARLRAGGGEPSFERRLVRPDGAMVWLHNTFSLLRDEEGRPRHALVTVQDVTSHRRLDDRLERRAERLRAERRWIEDVLDLAPVGIVFLEPGTGRVLFANRAADDMAGGELPREAAAGRYREGFHCTDRDGRVLPDERLPGMRLAGGEPLEPYELNWHVGERVYPLLVSGGVLPPMHDEPATVIVVFQDVTPLRRAEEELQALNRQLRRKNVELEHFVYTVSHDLKAPLVTIIGFTGAAREDLEAVGGEAAGEVAAMLARVERAARRMSDRLVDVLELARVGTLPIAPERVDVAALVADLVRELGAESVTASADLPPAWADRRRLCQVFENLLANALKYGGGRIEVGGEVADGETRYFVRDHGPGVPETQRGRVFGLFQRLEPAVEGTGVGLTIVARVLEAHGGRAWVEETPGGGATFWIALPARDEA